MDNNTTESTIRGFCIGRNSWNLINTINGPQASATIYSIAETTKVNSLRPYDYFKHPLEEIPKYMDDKSFDFLENLLPWSPTLSETCRKPKQAE